MSRLSEFLLTPTCPLPFSPPISLNVLQKDNKNILFRVEKNPAVAKTRTSNLSVENLHLIPDNSGRPPLYGNIRLIFYRDKNILLSSEGRCQKCGLLSQSAE